MHKAYLIAGSVIAGLAVVIGAFGAHGLKKLVAPETIASFQTGVQYQIYHAFALLILAIVYERWTNNYIHYAGLFFIVGVLLFSGSIYLLVFFKAMNKIAFPGLGLITPIGGLLFITGWVLFIVGLLKK